MTDQQIVALWNIRCRKSRNAAVRNAPLLTREKTTVTEIVAVLRAAVSVREKERLDRLCRPIAHTAAYAANTHALEHEAEWLEKQARTLSAR